MGESPHEGKKKERKEEGRKEGRKEEKACEFRCLWVGWGLAMEGKKRGGLTLILWLPFPSPSCFPFFSRFTAWDGWMMDGFPAR